MRYGEPAPITEDELGAIMATDDLEAKYRGIIRASLHIPGSDLLHLTLVECLAEGAVNAEAWVLAEAALTASSHVARLGHMTRPDVFLELVSHLLDHPKISGHAEVIRDDIRIFCR
ncbi:MAG: hypothetical protein AAGJ10_00115 [Bacteroidota bacterium]